MKRQAFSLSTDYPTAPSSFQLHQFFGGMGGMRPRCSITLKGDDIAVELEQAFTHCVNMLV
jgi:hypothetical protein